MERPSARVCATLFDGRFEVGLGSARIGEIVGGVESTEEVTLHGPASSCGVALSTAVHKAGRISRPLASAAPGRSSVRRMKALSSATPPGVAGRESSKPGE